MDTDTKTWIENLIIDIFNKKDNQTDIRNKFSYRTIAKCKQMVRIKHTHFVTLIKNIKQKTLISTQFRL